MGIHSTPLLLVVEDDWEFYNHLSQILEGNGYEVCAFAPTYEEGWALFQSWKPDAVLMDIELRGVLNGLQLAQEIRKTSDLPIIYLSHLFSDPVLEAARLTTPNDYLIKGKISDLDQILATLRMCLRVAKPVAIPVPKEKDGVMGLIGYKQNLPIADKKQAHTIPVPFEEILFFSTDDIEVKKGNKMELLKVQENYCWFAVKNLSATDGTPYRVLMLETSLAGLQKQLSDSFERINQKNIINLSAFEGLVNGFGSALKPQADVAGSKPVIKEEEKDDKRMHLKVAGKIFVVTDTYRKAVEEKLRERYVKF